MLRQKRRQGSPLTINELVLVYRRHTHEYYRKNGKVTREATIIDDVIRYLRKHHADHVPRGLWSRRARRACVTE